MSTRVIAVLNEKGGCGKSTIATNIARGLQLEGYRVLIADSDPQGTARDWRNAQDETDTPVVVGADRPTLHKDIPQVGDAFDFVVIDGAARAEKIQVSAIKAADLVLIPVQPSAADIWATQNLTELVLARQEITGKPQAAFLISRQITGTNLASGVQEALELFNVPVLRARTSQRVAYTEAMGEGLSVLDTEPGGKAADEVRSLVQETISLLSNGQET